MTNQDYPTVNKNSTLTSREVTKKNLSAIFKLKVSPTQEKYVAPNSISIAQAHFDHEIAWFRSIDADGTPVGFLMLSDDAKEQKSL